MLHLVRNTFRYASKAPWYELARDLPTIYTAATEQAAREPFDELADKWGERYPALIRLWENAWAEFVPFLAYNPEIRKVIYSTNAIANNGGAHAGSPPSTPSPSPSKADSETL